MTGTEKNTCASCGHTFTGRYCNNCGEKIIDEKERSILHFLGQMINAITFTDVRFLTSLKLLLFRPGFLAREYVTGRRNLYTVPLSLFFIGNLIYFILQPIDTFNTSLKTQIYHQKYSQFIYPIATEKAHKENVSLDQLEGKYDAKSEEISKLMLIVLVFLFSLPLSLLFYNRSQYYFNHLIFSLSFISFIIYSILLIIPYLRYGVLGLTSIILHQRITVNINNSWVTAGILGLLFTYLVSGLHRFYHQKYIWIIPKALLLTFSMILIVIGYRFFLFMVTIHLI